MTLVWAGLLLGGLWWRIFAHLGQSLAWSRGVDRSLGLSLELLLYSERPRTMGGVLIDLTQASLRLGWLLLPASLLSLLAALAVGIPLHWMCELRCPQVGESFLVSLRESTPARWEWSLPPQVQVEGPGIHVTTEQTTYWRLKANQAGPQPLRLESPGQVVELTVSVGQDWARPAWGSLRPHYARRDIWVGDYPVPLWLGLLFWAALWSVLGSGFRVLFLKGKNLVAGR